VGGDGASVLVKERLTEAAPVAGGSVVAGDILYWFSSHLRGSQLWRSDGTTDGTYPVVHFYSSTATPARLPARLGYANGQLFFPGHDPYNGYQLWTSNGTRATTHAIIGLHDGSQAPPAEFLTAGSRVFFPRVNDSTGVQLWAIDATSPISLATPPTLAVTNISTSTDGLTISGASESSSGSPLPAVINFALCGATDDHDTTSGGTPWVLFNHPDLSYSLITLNPGTTDIYITGISLNGVSNEITLTVKGPVAAPSAPVPPAISPRRRATN
jgi:ELWxxDGT repeat protein